MAVTAHLYPTVQDDASSLLQTIVGELRVVDQRLKVLLGQTQSDELLLARRFVAMAAEQAAFTVERMGSGPDEE